MSFQKKLKLVESILIKEPKGLPKTKEQHFTRLNLSVPKVRKIKKQSSLFKNLSSLEQLKVWDFIWKNTQYFDVMSLALYHYQHRSLTKSEFTKIKTWVNRCHCWEHSDDLSKIYAQALEKNSTLVFPSLKSWNKSKNPWRRRQSVVSLLEYASKRQKVLPFKTLINFVDNLITDEEYYVQKGLGWTLREIYNVYPTKTLKYINKNLREISPIAYSAATEKINKDIKKEMNKRRKVLRKKPSK